MFYVRHKNQKPGAWLALKKRRNGRRVSVDTRAGISLIQKPMGTVDNFSNGMKPTTCGFIACDVNQFHARSPGSSPVNPYYDSLKPFLLVMRAMGVLPFSSQAGGKYFGLNLRKYKLIPRNTTKYLTELS
jgi:hypothetical protein